MVIATVKSIYVDKASARAREILEPCVQFRLVDTKADAELLWLRKNYRKTYDRLNKRQLLNHIPKEGLMSRKGDLTDLLHDQLQYAKQGEYSPRDFYQESYNLSKVDQRLTFLDKLPDQDKEENLWIMKPSKLSRGIGVKILWEMDALKKELKNSSRTTIDFYGEELEYIIQRYIRDVLLLNKRKSEIRVYWLIASVDPLYVFMYPHGTVKFTTQEFKLGDYDNPLIHLTNTYQQKQQQGFDPDGLLKWDFDHLESYVHEELGLGEPNWLQRQLIPKLEKCLGYLARAAQKHLSAAQPHNGYFFALLGADFILDQNLNPWLTEVQKGPGLDYPDPFKRKIIPPMLREAIEIVFEIRDGKIAGQSLEELDSVKIFQRI